MAVKKKSASRKSSSGSDPKSKRIVKGKMTETMREYKDHQLTSGRSSKKVKNPKQAIAIALSEARRSGADIPPDPNQPKRAAKNSTPTAGKKVAAKKSVTKKVAKKAAGKRVAKKAAKKQ